MIVTFIRTTVIFTTLVIIMRLMGKRQIGEMQPFEFIVTLIIADLACIPMADVSIPLVYGLVAIVGLFILHQLLALLEQSGKGFKKLISGKPSLVINKNGVDLLELKKNNMGVEDLIESMRACGYFSLDDVDYAIFESNGNLSAMQKNDTENKPSSLPLLIVSDGKMDKDNIEAVGVDADKIRAFIKQNASTLKQTEVLTVDGNGRVYFKTKNRKFQILKFELPEGSKW